MAHPDQIRSALFSTEVLERARACNDYVVALAMASANRVDDDALAQRQLPDLLRQLDEKRSVLNRLVAETAVIPYKGNKLISLLRTVGDGESRAIQAAALTLLDRLNEATGSARATLNGAAATVSSDGEILREFLSAEVRLFTARMEANEEWALAALHALAAYPAAPQSWDPSEILSALRAIAQEGGAPPAATELLGVLRQVLEKGELAPEDLRALLPQASALVTGFQAGRDLLAGGQDIADLLDDPRMEPFHRGMALAQGAVSLVGQLAELLGDPTLTDAARAFTAYGSTVSKIADQIASFAVGNLTLTALSGNLLGLATGVLPLLVESKTPEELILEQVAALRQQVEDLRREVNGRFDRIDARLEAMYEFNRRQFAAIEDNLGEVKENVEALRAEVQRLHADLNRGLAALSGELRTGLQDEATQEYRYHYNRAILYPPDSFARRDFEDAEFAFLQLADTVARNNAFAQFLRRTYEPADFDDAGTAPSLLRNLNYLAAFAEREGNGDMLAPAPEDPVFGVKVLPYAPLWALGARAYVALVHRHPQYAPNLGVVDRFIAVGDELRSSLVNALWDLDSGEFRLREGFLRRLLDRVVGATEEWERAEAAFTERHRAAAGLAGLPVDPFAVLDPGQDLYQRYQGEPDGPVGTLWPAIVVPVSALSAEGFPALTAPVSFLPPPNDHFWAIIHLLRSAQHPGIVVRYATSWAGARDATSRCGTSTFDRARVRVELAFRDQPLASREAVYEEVIVRYSRSGAPNCICKPLCQQRVRSRLSLREHLQLNWDVPFRQSDSNTPWIGQGGFRERFGALAVGGPGADALSQADRDAMQRYLELRLERDGQLATSLRLNTPPVDEELRAAALRLDEARAMLSAFVQIGLRRELDVDVALRQLIFSSNRAYFTTREVREGYTWAEGGGGGRPVGARVQVAERARRLRESVLQAVSPGTAPQFRRPTLPLVDEQLAHLQTLRALYPPPHA